MLLSVIAGMVDLTGYLTFGIFTAHITGNLVVATAVLVHGGAVNLTQLLAIPVFILAVAAIWLVARASARSGKELVRLLLLIQFILITCVMIITGVTKTNTNSHGLMALIAAMVAVASIACQFALLRLAIPSAPSTAVMTGNLTNTTLSVLDTMLPNQRLLDRTAELRLRNSLYLLVGFLGGCIISALAVTLLADWAWALPVALSGIAIALI